MAISFKTKHNWGQTLYIKDDPEQLARTLVNITLTPGAAIYTLTVAGEGVEVYEFQVSEEPDQDVLLSITRREE